MSLIDCPECRAKVSEKADSCPHCGHPIGRGFMGRSGMEQLMNYTTLLVLIAAACYAAYHWLLA